MKLEDRIKKRITTGHVITVQVSKDVMETLDVMANKLNTSRAELVRIAIEDFLKNNE